MLGTEKTCSRNAAKIDYDEVKKEFVIQVMGKNGILLNRKKIAKGETRSLGRRSSLKIGPYKIYFLIAVKNETLLNHNEDVVVLGKPLTTSEADDESRASVSSTSNRSKRLRNYKERLIEAFQTHYQNGKSASVADLCESLIKMYPEDLADRNMNSLKRTIVKVLKREEEIFVPVPGHDVLHYTLNESLRNDDAGAPEKKKQRRVELMSVVV